MHEKNLPARPNLEQFKKQAKELARDCRLGLPDANARLQKHHPNLSSPARVALADAQLVIAREHGFESWPKFAAHIQTIVLQKKLTSITDPLSAFLIAATSPRDSGHASGTLEEAELILAKHPHVAKANIYAAAVLGDEPTVQHFLAQDTQAATAKGAPHDWDALTYLCFSRYMRIDRSRSDAFVRTAKALLDAGASANTGWWETIDLDTTPRQIPETAIYGAAGVAHHPQLTKLLLDYGADPNDEETPYHVPEGYDNEVMQILLESGKLSPKHLVWMLVRKADWHDEVGMKLVLEAGADPNNIPHWGNNALQHSVQRDNGLVMIEMLLDFGADPQLKNQRDGSTAIQMAARRGRGDVLQLFEERRFNLTLEGVDALIAACAMADYSSIEKIKGAEPALVSQVITQGGTLLSQFAGNGNSEGVRCLLDLGVPVDALCSHGDPYFEIAPHSTALHCAAWRAWPSTVKLLIERGASINIKDGRGRTALMLAVRACVDSYWMRRRTPESVRDLLNTGASLEGIEIPCGYDEVDEILTRATENSPAP